MKGVDSATERVMKLFSLKQEDVPKLLSREDVSFFYASMSSYLQRFQFFQEQMNLTKCTELLIEMSIMLGIQCNKMGLRSIYNELCRTMVTELTNEKNNLPVDKYLLKHSSGEPMTINGENEYVYKKIDDILIHFFEKLN